MITDRSRENYAICSELELHEPLAGGGGVGWGVSVFAYVHCLKRDVYALYSRIRQPGRQVHY